MKEIFNELTDIKFKINNDDRKYSLFIVSDAYIGLKYEKNNEKIIEYIPYKVISKVNVNTLLVEVKTNYFYMEKFLEGLEEKMYLSVGGYIEDLKD